MHEHCYVRVVILFDIRLEKFDYSFRNIDFLMYYR